MNLAEIICSAYVALALPNADIACEHMDTLVEAAEQHDVDPATMTALIFVESRWTPTAVSRSNACGLTQVLPRYSAGTRNRFGKKLTCEELKNPTVSIKRGTQILSYFLKRYRKNYARSLCSYNAGASRCRKGAVKNKGHRYANKVLRFAVKLRRKMKRIEREALTEEYVPGCYE